jgi:uncharacterized repeat protein (TIGR01451 family)
VGRNPLWLSRRSITLEWRKVSGGLILSAALLMGLSTAVPVSASAAATTSKAVSVTMSESVGPNRVTNQTVYVGEWISFNVTVRNSGSAATGPVTFVDGNVWGKQLVTGSATCGTLPNCSVQFSKGLQIQFVLTSIPVGAHGVGHFKIKAGSRVVHDAAFWKGSGCAKATCTTNVIQNKVIPDPVTLSSAPPNRALVPQTHLITLDVSVAPPAWAKGDGNVVISNIVPYCVGCSPGTTYVAGSASCGTVVGCTSSVSGKTVTFVLTPASFASGATTLQVQFVVKNQACTGTLYYIVSWTGGTCIGHTCYPPFSLAYSAIPNHTACPPKKVKVKVKTTPTTSPTTGATTVSSTAPAVSTAPTSLAATGAGSGLWDVLWASVCMLLLGAFLWTRERRFRVATVRVGRARRR